MQTWSAIGNKETAAAIVQTSRSIVELARYLISSVGFEFVLLGTIQSDSIERRFSWYRQKSGRNYLISVKDILNTEKKNKNTVFY